MPGAAVGPGRIRAAAVRFGRLLAWWCPSTYRKRAIAGFPVPMLSRGFRAARGGAPSAGKGAAATGRGPAKSPTRSPRAERSARARACERGAEEVKSAERRSGRPAAGSRGGEASGASAALRGPAPDARPGGRTVRPVFAPRTGLRRGAGGSEPVRIREAGATGLRRPRPCGARPGRRGARRGWRPPCRRRGEPRPGEGHGEPASREPEAWLRGDEWATGATGAGQGRVGREFPTASTAGPARTAFLEASAAKSDLQEFRQERVQFASAR